LRKTVTVVAVIDLHAGERGGILGDGQRIDGVTGLGGG
jgi:hypothetical protein